MATLTLKNVPDELYQRLKDEAARHRRSLNQEVIARLEASDAGTRTKEEILADITAFRERLAAKGVWASAEEVDRWIDEGRD